MADEKKDTPRPFDVRTIQDLLKFMAEYDLSEVDLKVGDQRIWLRKGGPAPVAFAQPQAYAAPPPPHAPQPTPAAANPPPPAAKKYQEIKSELPGVFYTRPAPDKPEFVKVGARVTPDTVVCYVTAMKVNNEIRAGVSGTITEVVAQNEQFVDYGHVLFLVDPS